jgi:nucleotide-binding universal stress UspA family protein
MNKALNKILVPVDFSDFSRKALPVAQELARVYKGKISPFHAYDLYSDMEGFHYDVDSFHADGDPATIDLAIKKKLRQFALDAVESEVLAESVTAQDNNTAQAIVEASGRFDMVVMSSHGRTGFMRILMGSVAEKVLRLGNRPIVIVEDASAFTPFRKILVPTDFSSNSLAALPYAQDIALATGAEVHLFHALCGDFNNPEQFEQQKQERLAKLHEIAEQHLPGMTVNLKYFVVHGADSAHNAIRKHVTEQHYNLIVMAAIGRTGLDHQPIGSTTATLIRAVHTTFMVIRPDA